MEVDPISSLPDCLLVEIISRLPSTKQAIKTSTLSRRWKYLWMEVSNLMFGDEPGDYRDYSPKEYVLFVDKAITQRRQQNLNKFQLHIPYSYSSSLLGTKVAFWIRYAINCNVRELDIALLMSFNYQGKFVFDQPFFVNPCFTHLKLKGCSMLISTGTIISWTNLRSLCITYGKLDEDLIQNILSGSPLLETLKLENCCGFRRIDVTSKSVKNLVFAGYMDLGDSGSRYIIKINAPYILSLTLQDIVQLKKLVLRNMSSLVQAHLDYTLGWNPLTEELSIHKEMEEEMLNEFIQNLSHVKKLTIGTCCLKVLSRLEAKGFTVPSNMKYLDILPVVYSYNRSS